MEAANPDLVNKAAIARLLKVGEGRVSQFVREGMPVHKKGSPGISTIFNIPDVIAWQRERARTEHLKPKGGRPRKNPIDTEANTKPITNDPRHRLREIDLELRELELAKARREYVKIDEVMGLAAEQIGEMRSVLLNVAGECGRKYGRQIEEFVREQIMAALKKITLDQQPYIAREDEE